MFATSLDELNPILISGLLLVPKVPINLRSTLKVIDSPAPDTEKPCYQAAFCQSFDKVIAPIEVSTIHVVLVKEESQPN